jgi:hypothetical protein
MNVIDKRIKGNFVDFKDVDYGMPFEFEVSFFLKINNGLVKNDDFTNAVNLKTGMACRFDDEYKVRLVNGSIVINDFEGM